MIQLNTETIVPVLISALSGGFLVSVVRYFRDLPLTKAKAKRIDTELSVILIEKIKEYNQKLEERVAKNEIEIEALRKEKDELLKEVYHLKYLLKKYENDANKI